MYIQLNSEKIRLDFNSGIKCYVDGPDSYYYIQVNEFVNGSDYPTYVEAYTINKFNPLRKIYSLPIEFYMDFEIHVSKFVPEVGMIRIFSHRFSEYGQYVRFEIQTEDFDECEYWVSKIKEYQSIKGCKIILDTPYDEFNKMSENYYNPKSITPYKTYKVGRFPKVSNDFRTNDERCEGLIWFGYWKKFWSYQHPRNWNILSSQEIVEDILGLSK